MSSASRAVRGPVGGARGSLRGRGVVGSFGVCVAVALVCAHGAMGSHASHASAFREFPIPTGIDRPGGIAFGPDGNVWFAATHTNKIGRITPSGKFKLFPLPAARSNPAGITAGPDGNVWFTEASEIGRITPSGKISEFPIPATEVVFGSTAPPLTGSSPYGITTGPDGNLWFTEWLADKIGRITPSGTISEFQIPTRHSSPSYGITTGRDGNLWFTEESVDKIGRITPSGKFSEFPLPKGETESRPTAITASPNGNLWFTELVTNKIGRAEPRLLGQVSATKCVVPKLRGKTLTQAKILLRRAHCKLGKVTEPPNHKHKLVAVSQKPAAKRTLPGGTKVSLRLG